MENQCIVAINNLLNADPEDKGFIIFSADSDYKYVQYAREDFGLSLDWPIFSDRKERNNEIANKAVEILLKHGFSFYDENSNDPPFKILGYKKMMYSKINENISSLNANVGNDADEIYNLTKELFSYVFKFNNLNKVKIELELNNN